MLIKKQFSQYNSLNNKKKKKKKIHANYNTTDAGNDQSMLILTILEKIKEGRFLKEK